MRCPDCGRHIPSNIAVICAPCEDEDRQHESSVLVPVDPLVRLIEQTSVADFALFCIALARRDREKGLIP